MPLPKTSSLLIVCRALTPFVDVALLQKTNGVVGPSLAAQDVRIDPILKRLEKLDDEYDLHTITHILDFLHRSCWDAGYSLGMGPKQLLDHKQIETVGDLRDEVSRRTTKA